MSEIRTIKCDGCGQIRDDLVTILIRGKRGIGPDFPAYVGDRIRKDFCRPCLASPLIDLLTRDEISDAIAAFSGKVG